MDLGTVKAKLKSNKYATAEEFIKDVRLIFTNCYTWNGRDQGISRLAMSLSHIFEFELAKMPDPPAGGESPLPENDEEDNGQSATVVSDVSGIEFSAKTQLSVLSEGRWYPAVVLAVNSAERRVDIHFTGFKSGTDRDYSVDDPKIRAPPTAEDLEVIQRNIADGYATRAQLITAAVQVDDAAVEDEEEEDEVEVVSGAFAEEDGDEDEHDDDVDDDAAADDDDDDDTPLEAMKGKRKHGRASIAAVAAKRARNGGGRGGRTRGGSWRGGRGGRGRGGRGRNGTAVDEFEFFEANNGSGGPGPLLKQLLHRKLSTARFKHAWPLLVAQEIASLDLLELIPLEGLQKAGMKLGAAVAVKQVMADFAENGKKSKKKGGKAAAGMDDDETNDADEDKGALEEMLRQSFAPAQFNKRWKKLQEQMVTDLKVLGGCTVLQLQDVGIKLGGAAAIKHAVRGL